MQQEEQGSVWVIVAFVAVFVAILAIVIIQKFKRKGAQWTGVVIDKDMSETVNRNNMNRGNTMGGNNNGISIGFGNGNNAVNRSYRLKIRGDDGKEFNWPVGEGFYVSVNVGDRLQKQPGTETPVVLSKAQAGSVDQQTVQSQPANPSAISGDQQPPTTPGTV